MDAPEAVSVAVLELLQRPFVDRVQADERPRGYRRSGRGIVDMLVPGMAEHFIARMRGLWLPYPDGTVVTAREATGPPDRGGRAGGDGPVGHRSVGPPRHARRERGDPECPTLGEGQRPSQRDPAVR